MKRCVPAMVAVALVALTGGVAFAQGTVSELGGKLQVGNALVIGDRSGDVYAFAGEVRVEGTVTGDLVVSSGTVTISGDVDGDVLVLAGEVDIPGRIEGDLRGAAGRVIVSGQVGEDILVGAGRLDVRGEVGEDLIFGAGEVTVSGDVAGDVLGNAGAYMRSGTVGGRENVTVGQPREEPRRSPISRAIGQFVSAFLVGMALLTYRRRRWIDETVSLISDSPGSSLGWGLIFLVSLGAIPLGVLIVGILFAIFFGWLGLDPLTALTLVGMVASWAAVALIGVTVVTLLAPVTVGTWLAAKVLPGDTPIYLVMAAGLAALVIVELLPVLGALVGLAVTVIGGGAWLRAAWPRRPSRSGSRSRPESTRDAPSNYEA